MLMEKQEYEAPCIIYEGSLEIRAGSTLSEIEEFLE